MEVSASSCSRFLIDSLLSLRPPGALLSWADPPELSPARSGGCSAPPSPQRAHVPRLESVALPGRLQQLQPRAVSSSFLIRDILADCRSCLDPGQPERRAEPFQSAPEEDFQDKSDSNASSDSESRGEKRAQSDIDNKQ